ncbi:IDLSRF-like peptide [Clonorchis sinensis]|uniref:IDLSRF-like peptide n=1 Tax=Clonorchis sinensis TaxID=79923 RepID=A0A8T1MVN9_CLOSI|nr:IDLSRF-like peptide [Clonorchis sinensis]
MMFRSCVFFLLVFAFHTTVLRTGYVEAAANRGNDCPESKPWPCRTPGICLSFALICDGEPDCPEEYDEDQEMCTAKLRPAEEHLQGFINKYREWLIPDILGEGKPEDLATKLVESRNIVDYARAAHLTPAQVQRLVELLMGVKSGKQILLHMMGMPLGAWSELYVLFYRIYLSGFLNDVDRLQTTEEQRDKYWTKRSFHRYFH